MHKNSLDAYEAIKPELSKLQYEVLELIKNRPGHTSRYYAYLLGKPLNAVSGRFTELKNYQIIKEIGKKGGCATFAIRSTDDPLNEIKLSWKEKYQLLCNDVRDAQSGHIDISEIIC